MQHIASGIDSSLTVTEWSGTVADADTLAGYTEWGATWHGEEVYLFWNWGISQDVLYVLNPAAIKANIQLFDDDCTVASFLLNRAHLFKWIETLAWRDTVRAVIARSK